MYKCECGRKFITQRGFSYHKKFCGQIGIDGGYEYFIDMDGKLIYVHRDVLEKKLGRKLQPGEISHHIDGNVRNNHPDNLEVMTMSEHAKHHYESASPEEKIRRNNHLNEVRKKVRPLRGSKNPNAQLNEEQVREIKIKLQDGRTMSSLGKEYNVKPSLIQDISSGRSWRHVQVGA